MPNRLVPETGHPDLDAIVVELFPRAEVDPRHAWAVGLRLLRGEPGELLRCHLEEYAVICGHEGARYVLFEATNVVQTGCCANAALLARSAAEWVSAVRSLARTHPDFWGANAYELTALLGAVRLVEDAARDLAVGDTPDARRRLLAALRRYATRIRPFLDDYAGVIDRINRLATA
jgi:hypothetical protein